ncbi:MAG: NARF domain-containing protein [Saprospiraceae bacterium]
MLDQFQHTLKRTLAENLGQCIKHIEASLDPQRETYNNCLQLLADFNRLERENMNNLLARDDYNLEFSKLTQRTLFLIDNLDEADLSAARRLREEIHERILVVVHPDRKAQMERFFSKNYFKNVRYITYGDGIPAEHFDLAILDNMVPEPIPQVSMLLEEYADGIPFYILYFGETYPFNQVQYADKIYFANSIFSLYARIREMLDFMKYYDNAAPTGRS